MHPALLGNILHLEERSELYKRSPTQKLEEFPGRPQKVHDFKLAKRQKMFTAEALSTGSLQEGGRNGVAKSASFSGSKSAGYFQEPKLCL